MKKKGNVISILLYGLIITALTVFSIICIYPFYRIFIYSISDPTMAANGVYLLPRGFTMENYVQLFSQNNIMHCAFISVARTLAGMSLTIFCTSLFAFLLAQNKLKFRKLIYRMVVVTMYLNTGLIPWYVTMMKYGLKNNFLLYVLPSAVIAFYLILCKTYIEQLPPALQESAMIDGAGPFTIFIHIIIPICKPILATIAIFSAVDQWNSWVDNFYLADTDNLKTLQLLLLNYLSDQAASVTSAAAEMTRSAVKVTPTSIQMTITIIVSFPILFVYPLFQRYFVKGIMIGAVKG